MSMTVNIQSRAFSNELQTLPVRFTVQRYSWSVFGGPKLAEISVAGENENDLWEMIERLRCPLQIYSERGDPVWWGFVAGVDLSLPAWTVGVNIDSMYNKIAVAYTAEGGRSTTDWLSDADSVAEYGTKELLYTSSGSAAAHAEAARAMILAQKKYPIPTIAPAEGDEIGVVLRGRGWYDMLSWRYYANAGANLVDTATQISTIITAAGEYISAVDLEVASGLSISEFRDGDGSALFEVEELLRMGTSSFKRMLASVDINRRMRIYEEPTSSNPYLITKTGELRDAFDTPVRREQCPVGVYARLKDIIPGSLDTSKLADPSLMFIEEAEYTPGDDKLILTPRGLESPWDIGVVIDG